jgi:putative membrane protein
MQTLIVHLVVLTAAVLLSARLIPGVRVKSVPAAIGTAAVFSVLNFCLSWLLKVLLVIPSILTLGLLWFFVPLIVNAALLWLTDRLLKSFEIESAKALWLMALMTTVGLWLLHHFLR